MNEAFKEIILCENQLDRYKTLWEIATDCQKPENNLPKGPTGKHSVTERPQIPHSFGKYSVGLRSQMPHSFGKM